MNDASGPRSGVEAGGLGSLPPPSQPSVGWHQDRQVHGAKRHWDGRSWSGIYSQDERWKWDGTSWASAVESEQQMNTPSHAAQAARPASEVASELVGKAKSLWERNPALVLVIGVGAFVLFVAAGIGLTSKGGRSTDYIPLVHGDVSVAADIFSGGPTCRGYSDGSAIYLTDADGSVLSSGRLSKPDPSLCHFTFSMIGVEVPKGSQLQITDAPGDPGAFFSSSELSSNGGYVEVSVG